MAIKTETLTKESLDTILDYQKKVNELVFTLGQIHLDKRNLTSRLETVKTAEKNVEDEFDKIDVEFSAHLKDLETKYPKGEIDLNSGTITYDDSTDVVSQ
jgi:hypothetical protein